MTRRTHFAARDPTANHDSLHGFAAGTLWRNRETGHVFLLAYDAPTDARWHRLTPEVPRALLALREDRVAELNEDVQVALALGIAMAAVRAKLFEEAQA